MKNTPRIHRKTVTKNPNSQVKIDFGEEFKMPPDAPNACCIAILNRVDGAMFRIPISEKEYEDIWQRSIKPGAQTLVDFIATAIQDKLDSVRFGQDDELECAINQATAFSALMKHHFHFPPEGEHMDNFKCGLVELSAATFKRLRRASEGAFQSETNSFKREEVAA